MTILFLLILISLLVAVIFIGAFMWAARNGQYDDIYTPTVRMLFDDEDKTTKNHNKKIYNDENGTV